MSVRPKYWLLEGKKLVPTTMLRWAHWMETGERLLWKTGNDEIMVSTIFLGLDHSPFPYGPPLVFETMIFGGEHDKEEWRYSTWDEAEAGHQEAVRLAFPALAKETTHD